MSVAREGWPVPHLWPDSPTAVIIAGGPSLALPQIRHVAMAHLEGKCRVVVVNDAVFVAWWADWLHGCDYKWWNWHRNTATKFSGVRTTCTETVPPAWAHYLRCPPPDDKGLRGGFADAPDEVAGGGNGGYQAMQIAVKAGAQRLLLVAFDMKRGGADGTGESHWFGDHQDACPSDYEGTMLVNFPSLVAPLKDRGVEVINCTPGSALTCFPTGLLEDVL